MKDRSITIKVETELYDKLKADADKLGLSLSVYIRLILSKGVDKLRLTIDISEKQDGK